MIDKMIDIDTKVFLYLNGFHSPFLDTLMYYASSKLFWFPFYFLLLLFLLIKFKKKSITILVSILLLITFSDQLSSSIIKPIFKRERPSHNIELKNKIYISEAGPGGKYGFVSSHATNSFALFFYLFYLFQNRYKKLMSLILTWALLVSYSRVYNGVHFPLDIVGGILIGFLCATITYRFTKYLFKNYQYDIL